MRRTMVLGTGGTISGESGAGASPLAYEAGRVGIDRLLAGLPVPNSHAVGWEQVAQVDSKDLGFDLWQRLAARCAD